jgi:hypothetical protein
MRLLFLLLVLSGYRQLMGTGCKRMLQIRLIKMLETHIGGRGRIKRRHPRNQLIKLIVDG